MMEIVSFIIIGIIAGILSGLFGIGGGIVIIPALVIFLGFDQLTAQGTSLAILLPPVGLLGFLEYYKKGNVNLTAAIIICIFLAIGAKFGARFAQQLPMPTMKKVFGAFLILVGIKTIFGK